MELKPRLGREDPPLDACPVEVNAEVPDAWPLDALPLEEGE